MNVIRKFLDARDGSVTVEFVLWVPFMVLSILIPVDGTMLLFRQAEMTDLARDASRQVALGYRTPEEAEDRLAVALDDGRDYTIDVRQENGFVTTTITVPFSDVLLFGGPFSRDATISGRVTMLEEQSNA